MNLTRRPDRLSPRWLSWLAAALLLGGCAGSLVPQPPPAPIPPEVAQVALPPMRSFGAPRPLAPQRSNTEIARDFIDLSFELESGSKLDRFTRFEGPVTISLAGLNSPHADRELDRLISRLRNEARLPVSRVPDGAPAQIVVEGITRRDLERVVPEAACFVLPTRVTWDEFRRNTRRRDLAWSSLQRREAVTVFIPVDIAPQEIRDCLHEEIAQALGPLNDLYRLEDSIFNDDNLHSVLTGFDMLILRTTYDPRLQNGMSRNQVAAQLPAILTDLNPRGNSVRTRPYQPSPRNWQDSIERALAPAGSSAGRRTAANRALSVAQDQGWQDTRMGLSLFTAGRLAAPRDGDLALEAFLGAGEVYSARPATQIHAAHVGMQIAAFALASGEYQVALDIVARFAPVAQRAENAALLADLLFVQAAAQSALGQDSAAAASLSEGLAWGQFGFRTEAEMRRRAAEIAALAPTSAARRSAA
ncbi:MAG: DUF2927 domain-containing protein [Rhodobacteraceae bacterium]|nr:DUF2927 domain-containing protein [Paracoccaceae bacterium]